MTQVFLGIIAFAAVILQAVLGGLRVVLFKDAIGIFHAVLAQVFFVLLCAIALLTSKWWQKQKRVQTNVAADVSRLPSKTVKRSEPPYVG